jgi:hypothetical protein
VGVRLDVQCRHIGARGIPRVRARVLERYGALSFDEGAIRNACLFGGSVFEIPGVSGAIGQRFRNGAQYALRATFVRAKRRYTVMLTTTTLLPAEEIAYAARFAVAVAR